MLWLPPAPAIILPKPADIIRPGDPRFIFEAVLPGLAGLGGKGAAAAGGGYTPPPGSWLGLWDASVGSSLSLSGSALKNWNDLGGGGNHLGDGTTTNKPVYSATGFNTSYPTIQLSLSHTIQGSAAFPMGTGNTLTWFWVGSIGSASQSNGRAISYWGGVNSDFSDAGSWIFFRPGTAQSMGMMRTSVSVSQAITYDAPTIWIGTINSSGVETLYTNGVASSTATSAGNWLNNGTLGLGASITDTVGITGLVSHWGISAAFTNSTDVATLYNDLKARWGL